MSVERRLRHYAQTVTHELQKIDQDGLFDRIHAAVQADEAAADNDDPIDPGAGHLIVAGPSGPSREGPLARADLEEELQYHQNQAEKGDAASARRVAEVWGLLDREDEAAAWWRRAAELGDPDAVDYIQEYLAEPVDDLTERTDTQRFSPDPIVKHQAL